MKKLLIASDNFLPRWDGISRFLSEVIPKLSAEYQITVIAPDYGPIQQKFSGINIIRFNPMKLSINAYSPAIPDSKILAREISKTDIVWVQAIGPIGSKAVKLAFKYDKPVMAYIHSLEWELASKGVTHNNILRRTIRSLVKRMAISAYSKCDLILVPSLEVKEILSWMGIRSKKMIVNLGVDTKKFVPPTSRIEQKKKLKIDPTKFVIGYSGRLGLEKSLITLHRAFLRLIRRRKDIELLIVGGGLKSTEALFKDKPHMHFAGFRNNVVDYLQAMDIYVLPSLTETTSLSTMEAMSCEVAPICTPVGFLKDYIQEGYNGSFFGIGDFYTLSRKIETLISDQDQLHKIQQNARKTIISSYSWAKTIEGLKKALSHF